MSFIHRLGRAGTTWLLVCSTAALAGNVTIPNTFTAHTPAVATQVNANFGAVATAVNGSATDIASLQAAITGLQATVTTLSGTVTTLNATVATQQTTITTLTSQMAAVQGSSVMALAANLDMIDVQDPNNPSVYYPTAQFHGINVRIVNGMGATYTTNGLGNLTVGYNETDPGATPFCSYGYYADQTTCQNNGYTWAKNQRGGSHNLIVGEANAYSRYGGFLAGYKNIVNGQYASVSGGQNNTASGILSSVSGGYWNSASGTGSTVSGGQNNTASGNWSAVSGGVVNTASGDQSSVSGGYNRTASDQYDWVAGALFQDQ